MEIKIATISMKKFFPIALLSIPLILFLSWGLAVLTDNMWFVYLLIPFLILSIYLAQKLSNSETIIQLSEADHFRIDEEEIAYKSVIGYFVNDQGLTQTAFCIRLDTDKTIQIVSSSVGKKGEAFKKAQDELLEALKRKNEDIRELEYQDVYVRQLTILRPVIYVSIAMILILDVLAIFLLVTGKMKLPWQIFFANSLLLGLIPLLKKKKE